MTDKKKPSGHSKTLQDQYALTTSRAKDRIAQRDKAGRVAETFSEDDWETILDRISSGEIPAQVMRSFGATPASLNAKAKRDGEFNKRLTEAYETAFFNFMIDARSVARGLEGYTTNNIERDKLIIDTDWKMAKALVPRLIDKQQVDQRSITINISGDDTTW